MGIIMRQEPNEIRDLGAIVKREIRVGPGTYRFTIMDALQDGICCDFGQGMVEIYVDGTLIRTIGGAFGGEAQATFVIGDVATDESDRGTRYFAEAAYDAFPLEFGWWIRNLDTKEIVIERKAGYTDVLNDFMKEEIVLVPGESYTLALRDSFADGINGGGGDGYVEVYQIRDGLRKTLARDEGDFGASRNIRFTVPSSVVPVPDPPDDITPPSDGNPGDIDIPVVEANPPAIPDFNPSGSLQPLAHHLASATLLPTFVVYLLQ